MKFILLALLIGYSFHPKKKILDKAITNQIDCITNEKKAKELAEEVWLQAYGKRIYNEMPFIATLHDSVWIVKGSKSGRKKGGVAYVELRKVDCKVLKISHGK
jgi:hypothetical protein